MGSVAVELRRQRDVDIPRFMKAEAHRAMRESRDQIRERTPVGRRIDPDSGVDLGPSGRLRRSVNGRQPRRTKPGHSYTTGAHSERREASIVELGASPHIIRARRAKSLRWWNGPGNVRFAKSVNHPGFEGHHMFAVGINAALAAEMTGANIRLQKAITWRR